jgi:hypothetical protein
MIGLTINVYSELLLDIRQRIGGALFHAGESPQSSRQPCFTVLFEPDPDFIARPNVLAWIKEKYTKTTRRVALVGMGGFG